MTVFGFSLSRAAHSYGWALGVILAVVLLALFSHLAGPKAVSPVIKTETKMVVPAEPGGSYPVDVFCEDPLTTVVRTFAPDGPAVMYHLQRGKTEAIDWAYAQPFPLAQRTFIGADGVQHSDQVTVTDEAFKCMTRKGGQP